jgi:hypothetical protein
MRRQLALIPILLLLSLAGCGGRTDGTMGEAPTATTAPTVTASPPSKPATTPPKEPAATGTTPAQVSKAKPSGSGDPRRGTQYAFLRSSKLSTRQITYDLIEWYGGKEAVKACAEDGKKPAENDYCEGWYIRNNNKKLRTLTVHPDAPIRLTVAGEMKSVDLKTFLSKVDNGNVIRFDIDANRIMKLEHIYLP